MLRSVVVIGVLACASTGCSLLFVKPPSSDGAKQCTRSKLAPVLDALAGSAEVVRTGVAIAAEDSEYQDAPISRSTDIALGVGFTALFVGSAIYGAVNTSECSKQYERRAAEYYPDGSEQRLLSRRDPSWNQQKP